MVSAVSWRALANSCSNLGQMFFDRLALFVDAGQIGGQFLPLIGEGGLQLLGAVFGGGELLDVSLHGIDFGQHADAATRQLIELGRVIAEPALVEHLGGLVDLIGRKRIAVFVEAEFAPRIVVGGRVFAVTQVFVDDCLGRICLS